VADLSATSGDAPASGAFFTSGQLQSAAVSSPLASLSLCPPSFREAGHPDGQTAFEVRRGGESLPGGVGRQGEGDTAE